MMTPDEAREYAYMRYRALTRQACGAAAMMKAELPGAEEMYRGLQMEIEALNKQYQFKVAGQSSRERRAALRAVV